MQNKTKKAIYNILKYATCILEVVPVTGSLIEKILDDKIDEQLEGIPEDMPDAANVLHQECFPEETILVVIDILEKQQFEARPLAGRFDQEETARALVTQWEAEQGTPADEDVYDALQVYLDALNDWAIDHEDTIKQFWQETEKRLKTLEGKTDDLENRVGHVEKALSDTPGMASLGERLELYYRGQIYEFEKEGEEETIVGKEPLATAYIEPMTMVDGNRSSLLDYVEHWLGTSKPGVLLLHGEPGHGKTTFCQKMVYEFAKGRRFQTAKHVVQFTLNEATSGIITEKGKVNIANAFHTPEEPEKLLFELKEAEGMLIILDGYDEVRMALEKAGVENFYQFKERLDKLAGIYKVHFVVTSRTNAVKDFSRWNERGAFLPLSSEELDTWCTERSEYKEYWENNLKKICEKEYGEDDNSPQKHLAMMLKIPLIFRMIVHQKYTLNNETSNRAKLYEELFDETMNKHFQGEKKKALNIQYQELAYDIFCHDEDMAERKDELKSLLLFSYYTKGSLGDDNNEIGFIHRSFYQYYAALYFYNELKNCTEKNSKAFLRKLAERRIDGDILGYFNEIVVNKAEYAMNSRAVCVLKKLEETEAIIPSKPFNEKGTAEKSEFERCNNIYGNTLNLIFNFDIGKAFAESKAAKLLNRYRCDGLIMASHVLGHTNEEQKIDLSGITFENASFQNALLYGVQLRRGSMQNVNFDHAHLMHCDFNRTFMKHLNFSHASLFAVKCKNVRMEHVDFYYVYAMAFNASNASIDRVSFQKAEFLDSDFVATRFSNVDMQRVRFMKCDFRYAEFKDVMFDETTRFDGSKMLLKQKPFLESKGVNVDVIEWCES